MASFPVPDEYKIVRHVQSIRTYVTELDQSNTPNVCLAGVLQGAVGRTVDTPVFARCCWTIIRGFHTIAGGTGHAVGTRLDAVFPILQRLVDADFAAVEIGFYAQCWSCFSELDVG